MPQARRYCVGDWRAWDPKITTFPGVYLLAAAAARLLAAAGLPAAASCPTPLLRAVSAAAAAAVPPLAYALAAALDPTRPPRELRLAAAAAALAPPHLLYAFFFYTDAASTAATLACWLAAARGRTHWAAVLGAAAIAVRQTNAVWVAFVLAWAALDLLRLEDRVAGGGRRKGAGGKDAPSAARDAWPLAKRAWRLRRALVAELWPLAALVAAFAAFVAANGGVVVGDRAHHALVAHLAQPLYAALFITSMSAPLFWLPGQVAGSLRAAATAPLRALLWAAVAAAAVARGTLAHPFLLADNRHYAFYIWRRVINRTPWARYALVPLYLHALRALRTALAHRHPLRALLLAGATAAVLVPAHLLEPRYFAFPMVAALLLGRPRGGARALAAAVAAYAALDAALLYAFLARPFRWHDGSTARFLW